MVCQELKNILIKTRSLREIWQWFQICWLELQFCAAFAAPFGFWSQRQKKYQPYQAMVLQEAKSAKHPVWIPGESTRNWASPEGSSPLPSAGSSALVVGSLSPTQEDLCLVGPLSHSYCLWGEAIYPFYLLLPLRNQSKAGHGTRKGCHPGKAGGQFSLFSLSDEPISHHCW